MLLWIAEETYLAGNTVVYNIIINQFFPIR